MLSVSRGDSGDAPHAPMPRLQDTARPTHLLFIIVIPCGKDFQRLRRPTHRSMIELAGKAIMIPIYRNAT
jgi:hypothetical protein